METLQLIIKGIYLEEIIAGTKKIETRDIRPNTAKKYFVDLPDGDIEPRKYDAIVFYAGYNKDRKTATVEIVSAEIIFITDEKGNDRIYEVKGVEYIEAIIRYSLGKVLSHNYN